MPHDAGVVSIKLGYISMCSDRHEPQRKATRDGRNIPVTLTDPQLGVLSAIACSIKGNVKNIFLPPPEARV